MSDVAERLHSLDTESTAELESALAELARARDHVTQAAFLGDGEMVAVVARESADAAHDAAARRVAHLVLDAVRLQP